MGNVNQAVEWARQNLTQSQFEQFAQQLGLPKHDEYSCSVTFKWEPLQEPHLVTVEDIEQSIHAGLGDWAQARDVHVTVAKRSTY